MFPVGNLSKFTDPLYDLLKCSSREKYTQPAKNKITFKKKKKKEEKTEGKKSGGGGEERIT